MLRAIFYARFHPDRGPSIIHQYPPAGSVISAWDAANHNELFNVHDIVNYIIPTYELCERPLAIAVPAAASRPSDKQQARNSPASYRVLGFPVSIEDLKYDRNRFTFNVCYVLDADRDVRPWDLLVRKTAQFFKALEVEDGLLASEEDLPGLKWAGEEGYPAADVGIVHSVLEGVFEDLNAYGEACVRIDELHVLNLQLSREHDRPLPPRVQSYQVPLLIKELPSPSDWTWDLTLSKIVPSIDGIRHVAKIAEEADVELKLVKKTLRELLRHGCVLLLDLFHFQSCYMATPDFAWFVDDEEMIDECARYIADDPGSSFFGHAGRNDPSAGDSTTVPTTSRDRILDLYAALRPGLHLADFCLKHEAELAAIDIRRFITFGTIKGFLRRLHRYALVHDRSQQLPHNSSSSPTDGAGAETVSNSLAKSSEEMALELDKAWKKAALSSGWATPPSSLPDSPSFSRTAAGPGSGVMSRSTVSNEEARRAKDARLRRYLDGKHCLDQICVEVRMTEKQVVERLRSGGFGEVLLFWR
ncbi:nitrogen permease regulator 2 [Polychaeton citri CBS 116435]|uniref:Nitrogen permease regulator 2 n=1 Tax=Polychaeton citri CBS 116435 TaxID=1314669 RepID=A0A9P4Q738_9PEZI|nr:nitrogen permease regulator 2 [Polychaeton citri CBS 116435]